jgi:hypothetical protein
MSAELAAPPGEPDEVQVRFGRSRVLRALGAGLFAFAAESVLRSNPAWATHQPPPGPCFGGNRCDCCQGSSCCLSSCRHTHTHGCPSGGHCWWVRYAGCDWRCCDWEWSSTHRHCLCGTCVDT